MPFVSLPFKFCVFVACLSHHFYFIITKIHIKSLCQRLADGQNCYLQLWWTRKGVTSSYKILNKLPIISGRNILLYERTQKTSSRRYQIQTYVWAKGKCAMLRYAVCVEKKLPGTTFYCIHCSANVRVFIYAHDTHDAHICTPAHMMRNTGGNS